MMVWILIFEGRSLIVRILPTRALLINERPVYIFSAYVYIASQRARLACMGTSMVFEEDTMFHEQQISQSSK